MIPMRSHSDVVVSGLCFSQNRTRTWLECTHDGNRCQNLPISSAKNYSTNEDTVRISVPCCRGLCVSIPGSIPLTDVSQNTRWEKHVYVERHGGSMCAVLTKGELGLGPNSCLAQRGRMLSVLAQSAVAATFPALQLHVHKRAGMLMTLLT